jgi:hypothetical protein
MVGSNFYMRIRLSTASSISTGGSLRKPSVEIYRQFIKKTITRKSFLSLFFLSFSNKPQMINTMNIKVVDFENL